MSNEIEPTEKLESAKQEFMAQVEELRPDLFYPEHWGEAEKGVLAEQLRPSRVKTGMLSSIPMVCRGTKCPVHQLCPLYEQNIAPIGKLCPIEMAMVQQFFQAYVEELNVDTSRLVEVSMIRTLVDQEIQYLRKTKLLALEDFIQENVVGVDQDGAPITRKELHMAVDLEDRIHRRMDKIRTQLLATRESRAKIGQGQADTAQAIADLLDKAAELDRVREKALKKKLGKEYVDDYIDAEVVQQSTDE